MKLLIAIDDTDNKESFGTGRLSRMLAAELKKEGLAWETDVTRHQFLVHPAIPYTSHNSCSCIQALVDGEVIEKAFCLARKFLRTHYHFGANPGLCVSYSVPILKDLVAFGYRAQKEVLTVDEARHLAGRLKLQVWQGGRTGQGIIGAMGGIGLRSTDEDGRFIDLPGIRDLKGKVRVDTICRKTPIKKVITPLGKRLGGGEMVETLNWVRPVLKGGNPVLVVLKEENEWRTIEKAKRKGGQDE
jgi:hypothetical protein